MNKDLRKAIDAIEALMGEFEAAEDSEAEALIKNVYEVSRECYAGRLDRKVPADGQTWESVLDAETLESIRNPE